MKFAIEKVILWPRGDFEPQAYDFKPGVVNVITGAKQTGRTSFVNIIEYAFGAAECELPDAFNPTVDVVGVLVRTAEKRYLFVRAVPEVGRKVSDECEYQELPLEGEPEIPSSFALQMKSSDIRWYLDRIVCGEPGSEDRKAPEGQSEETAPVLSFQDVLNFSLQDDVTITNRHCLVRGMMDNGTGLTAKMKPYFKFLFGIESRDYVNVQSAMRELIKQKEAKCQERVRATNAYRNVLQNLEWMLMQAKSISLCPESVKVPSCTDPDNLVATARMVLDRNKDVVAPKINGAELEKVAKIIAEKESKLKELAEEAQYTQSEIERLQLMDARMADYFKSAEKTNERLQLSDWVSKFWTQRNLANPGGWYPVEAVEERVEKLKNELKKFGDSVMSLEKRSDYRAAFERELEHWKARLALQIKEHADMSEELKRLCAEDSDARKLIATQRSAYELLGSIRNACETWEKLNGDENSFDEVQRLGGEVSKLELKAATLKADEDKREEECRRFLANSIRERLASLFVRDDLKRMMPVFDIDKFTLKLSDGTMTRNISNVGASSNYICFHVAVSCALMEQFSLREDSPVQNFVIYDCPALEDGLDENGEPLHYAEQLIGTCEESLTDVKGHEWQPILMLQTPMNMFADDSTLHKVTHFAEGEGIIPKAWFK